MSSHLSNMTDPDVVYSDVKFTKSKGNATDKSPSSPPAETTYSEVRILKTEPSAEIPDSQQQAASDGGSKVTAERVALVVLSALLAAAVIALGLIFYKTNQTMEHAQMLRDENVALRKNITETKRYIIVKETCSQPPPEPCQTCRDGWERHKTQCYFFSNNRSSWDKARNECQHQGGDLVKIDSREEQMFLAEKLREKMTKPEDKFWIGLTDSVEEGTWLWPDGSPLNKSWEFWSGEEPDNWDGESADGEDCARMGEKAGCYELKCWFDKACQVPLRSICEKSAETGRRMCLL